MTKEEIKTMTKEERKRQLEWSDPYEFGTIYAEYLLEEKQGLIDYLKEEQDRLVRECSAIYEDGLGKTRLVNEEIYNEYKKGKIKTLENLKQYLKIILQRQYWSRCEYEIAVGGLSSKYPDEFEKIDAFRQIEMNLDRITEYVNWKMQLNLK